MNLTCLPSLPSDGFAKAMEVQKVDRITATSSLMAMVASTFCKFSSFNGLF